MAPATMSTARVLQRPPTQRELAAYRIAQRLDRPIATLGVVALALWLIEPTTSSQALLRAIVGTVPAPRSVVGRCRRDVVGND